MFNLVILNDVFLIGTKVTTRPFIILLDNAVKIFFFLISKPMCIKKRPIATQYTGDIQGSYSLTTKNKKAQENLTSPKWKLATLESLEGRESYLQYPI